MLVVSVTACSPTLETVEAPIAPPEPFSSVGEAPIPDKWWTAFSDPTLDSLVKNALEANLDLSANWEGFQASLAVVQRESSSLWPNVSVFASSTLDRPRETFAEPSEIRLGGAASYELDLWGRIKAGVQAEKYRARVSYYDYTTAAMSLSAQTSITWYRLIGARRQLALVKEQIENNEKIVKLIWARFSSGQIRAVDILRQRQLLESTRNQLIFYQTQIALLENELAVLLGRSPQNVDFPAVDTFPELPDVPQTGLPLELVRRRPDVQQAFYSVLAADREMAQAVRSKYPTLTLNLEGGFQSGDFSSLFQNWAYSLGGNLLAPLFNGGQIRAEVNRTEALKNQQLYLYGQTVLTAFREVEDALVREQQQRRHIKSLEQQLDLAEKTISQLRKEFLNGITDYLDVLLSLDEQQQLQRDLITARQEQLEIRVSLYRALAGSFETERSEDILWSELKDSRLYEQ